MQNVKNVKMLLRMGLNQPQLNCSDAQQVAGEELLFILGLFVCFMVGWLLVVGLLFILFGRLVVDFTSCS